MSFDKKLEQLRLQHTISNLLYKDNGVSSHFDYHVNLMSDDETIKLNLLTYNQKQKFFYPVSILIYIQASHLYPYTFSLVLVWS